ncbi:MAG: T9SS type A sorting domain-containing protein [candidate division WOR-3 bacterium]|nr:T9SS type A sorting domain-containing protein [candidate division WOR-3 bacterium]
MKNRAPHKWLLVTMLLLAAFCHADWTRDTVGIYTRYYEVKVGDGRNDNVERIYCCCYNGHVVEWSFEGNDWVMVDCGSVPPSADYRLISLCIGDGRRDGINRIYSACADGYIYEFSYDSGMWFMDRLSPAGVFYAGQVIGQPRNDDTIRVCAGGWNTPVREYTWNGSDWESLDVSSGNRYVWPLDIAQGRNDGVYRIYAPDWYLYYLREYSWNGSGYDELTISAPQRLVKAVVGHGRNDGMNRVYASGMLGHVHEYTYDANNWQSVDIHPTAPLRSRYGLCFGQTKSDGVLRLYSVAQGGDIREHAWDGAAWVDTIIDAISGATVDIAVGRGRNDDTMRVYVTSATGILYEFTNTSPYVGLEDLKQEQIGISLSFHPNPFAYLSTIKYSIPRSGWVSITVHNSLGVEVSRLLDKYDDAGSHILHCDMYDKYGMRLPAGVYFCRLKMEGEEIVEKIIRVN